MDYAGLAKLALGLLALLSILAGIWKYGRSREQIGFQKGAEHERKVLAERFKDIADAIYGPGRDERMLRDQGSWTANPDSGTKGQVVKDSGSDNQRTDTQGTVPDDRRSETLI